MENKKRLGYPTMLKIEQELPDTITTQDHINRYFNNNRITITLTIESFNSQVEDVQNGVNEICQKVLECYR